MKSPEFIKTIALCLFFLGCCTHVFGQLPSNIVGTWKRTAITGVDMAGKETDFQTQLLQTMPCIKNITYVFKTDGSFLTQVPDECGAMKKTIESMNGDGKCTMTGNKLIVTTSLKEIPPSTYTVQLKGNTMIWFFDYATNPKEHNFDGKSKSMTIVYTRL